MSETACHEFLMQGHAAFKAGRLTEALEHYRSAHEQDPQSAEANSAYGLVLLQMGRGPEAGPLLQRAVEITPSHAAYRMNLAEWLRQEGKLDQAERTVAGVAAEQPQLWQPWERLGELKARSKRFAEAETDFARAAALKPNDPSLLYKWARACFDNGRIEETLRILADASRLAPRHQAILRLYADVFESRAAWLDLERVAMDWTRAHPDSVDAWRSLAKAQWEGGYPRRAMQSFRTSLELGGRSAGRLATFGTICLHALELEAAAQALDEAESLDPQNQAMLSAKAMLLMWNARYDEAQAYCRRTLRVDPGDATAYKTLTQLTGGKLPDDDVAAIRSFADRSDTRTQDRITLLFALADCLDANERIDEAFACYERANRLAYERAQDEGLLYDPTATTRQTEELISIFGSVAPPTADLPGPRPIFIIGMPRSGTTLIETVIGAHSRVAAGGEKAGIRTILPEYLALIRYGPVDAIPESTWEKWRAVYRQEMPLPSGVDAVTDKNPWNFDALGLILRLFPGARIIHVRRNPVETGFSIFRNEFSKLVRFTHRLEDIGHYYGEYARVMAHWERVAAGRFTTVQYEDFVREFDAAGPALLAGCGLEWELDCGQFWKSKRAVSTISSMQVRRPLGKAAVRAQAYAAHLRPLVTALESAGVDLETGRLRDEAGSGPANS